MAGGQTACPPLLRPKNDGMRLRSVSNGKIAVGRQRLRTILPSLGLGRQDHGKPYPAQEKPALLAPNP